MKYCASASEEITDHPEIVMNTNALNMQKSINDKHKKSSIYNDNKQRSKKSNPIIATQTVER